MPTQRFLEELIQKRKMILEDIVWEKQDRLFLKFKVKVSAGTHGLEFNGLFNRDKNRVSSLSLVFQRKFPLVRIDKKRHANPLGTDGVTFTDWHKHKYNEVWKDDHAIDVAHEFNDNMTPGDFIMQFMEENNMVLARGVTYAQTFDDIKIKMSDS